MESKIRNTNGVGLIKLDNYDLPVVIWEGHAVWLGIHLCNNKNLSSLATYVKKLDAWVWKS